MSRWLLALLFAFGTVTFVAGCEEKPDKKDEKQGQKEEEGKEGKEGGEKEGEGEAAE